MNKYKNINFDTFAIEEDCKMTDDEKKKHMDNFYKTAKVVKSGLNKRKATRRFSRKFTAIAAAMVLVLAFGAVAYATDLFQLGKFENRYFGELETPFDENSNQYKAQNEYNEYVESVKEKDMPIVGYIEDFKPYKTKSGEVFPAEYIFPEKAVDLSKKYDLKLEKTETSSESYKKALKSTGNENLLGTFENEIKDFKEYYSNFGEKGSLGILFGDKYEVSVIPKDVFRTADFWNNADMAEGVWDKKTWNYTTKNGEKFKCASFKSESGYGDEQIDYKCVYIGKTSTFMFERTDSPWVKKVDNISQNEFEDLIEMFDLSKL